MNRDGSCVYFLSSVLRFLSGFEPIQALCMLPKSMWFHLCISLVSGSLCFLGVIHHSGSYNLSSCESWGEEIHIALLRLSDSLSISAHCPIGSLSIPIYCNKILWWGLSDVLIYRYSNTLLIVLLLLCFFSRILVDISQSSWPI